MNIKSEIGTRGIGITSYEELPKNPKYFTETSLSETLIIPKEKPDAEELLSMIVSPEVVSLRIIDTPVMSTPEGQTLLGAKLIIELKLKEKAIYVADEPTQSVHAAHYENVMKSVFIVIPREIDGISVYKKLQQGKIIVTPYVEDIYAVLKDKRTIFKNITMLIDVTFR